MIRQNKKQLFDQRNSIIDAEDARDKYINLKKIEAIFERFIPQLNDSKGFPLLCEDFRPGNIMVKSATDLEIVAVIDWEWTNALPFELSAIPPRFLGHMRPGDMGDKEVKGFERFLEIFLQELEKKEAASQPFYELTGQPLSALMRQNWKSGRVWFFELMHLHGIAADCWALQRLVETHPDLEKLGAVNEQEMQEFIDKKLKDLEMYNAELASLQQAAVRDECARPKS